MLRFSQARIDLSASATVRSLRHTRYGRRSILAGPISALACVRGFRRPFATVGKRKCRSNSRRAHKVFGRCGPAHAQLRHFNNLEARTQGAIEPAAVVRLCPHDPETPSTELQSTGDEDGRVRDRQFPRRWRCRMASRRDAPNDSETMRSAASSSPISRYSSD